MSRLELILAVILAISAVLNAGLVVYARAAVVQLLSISEELNDLGDMTDSLANHLQNVYKLESFYGDETLRSLLDHTVSYNEQLETFEYIYSLTRDPKITKEIDGNLNDNETEDAPQEA